MHIESARIEALVADPANARRHSTKNLEAIKGSLARFGQQKPIVIGKNGVVIAGNGTLEAAKSLGWTQIDVVRTELEGTDATAFAIADNRTGELAEWDAGVLSETLKSLQEMDFDLGSIGFDAKDLGAMIASPEPSEGLTDPDAVPEQVETRCRPGDLWILGGHRLLCGDSTNVLDVERLMGGEKADMVYTDPPYGMHLDADYKREGRSTGIYNGKDMKRASGVTHRNVAGDHDDFTPELISTVFACFPKCPEIFLWGADYYAEHIPDRNSGSWVVWDKVTKADGEVSGVSTFHGSNFELCWSKSRHQRDLARVMHKGLASVENDKRVHPTQKPVALAEWFFERWGKPEDLVADLFLGSGSTLIACEKTGRRCFGMELDPKYCDVILARWEAYTAKEARLQSAEETA